MVMSERSGSEMSAGYRYGFGGQEQDNELYGQGNSYTAEFWQYDTRLGRRWNVDPLFFKYNFLSPYSSFGNNPLNIVDSQGDTLTIGGNLNIAISDVFSIVDPMYHALIKITDNKVVVMATREMVEESNDPGLKILYDMSNSPNNYLYRVSWTSFERIRETNEIIEIDLSNFNYPSNVSITPRLEKGPAGMLPMEGFEGQVTIQPNRNATEVVDGVEYIKPRSSTVIHELIENFERTENGEPYICQQPNGKRDMNSIGAHDIAIERVKGGNPDIVGKTPGVSNSVTNQ